jgi:hypothetical protein
MAVQAFKINLEPEISGKYFASGFVMTNKLTEKQLTLQSRDSASTCSFCSRRLDMVFHRGACVAQFLSILLSWHSLSVIRSSSSLLRSSLSFHPECSLSLL